MNRTPNLFLSFFASCVLSTISVFLLSGCGSKDSTSATFAQANVHGQVFTQSPQAGASVTLKDSSGNVISSTVTDQNGFYQFSWIVTEPYMIKAVTQSGKPLYGVGVTESLNLTGLTNEILQIWFAATGRDLASVYESYQTASELPDPYEIEFVAAALMTQSDVLTGRPYMSLTEDGIDSAVGALLQQTGISVLNSTSFSASLMSNGLTQSFPVRAAVSLTGQVEFSGFPMLEVCSDN